MVLRVVRTLVLVGMMLGFIVPTSIAAQEATPAASPVGGAGPRLGGDLEAAATWLMSQQLEDGAFAGFSGEADAGTTVDAVIALVAARDQGVDTGTSIDDAIAWLGSEDIALIYQETGVGQAAKLVLALVAAGENPEDFASTSPLEIVQDGQAEDTGIYGTGIYDHAYALMALSATGSEVPTSAIDALESTQAENGGWAFDGSAEDAASDSNTTSMVIQALVASGNGDHSMVDGGLEFLLTTLDDEGGAGYAPGSEADSNSTALVAQAQISAGRDGTRALASLQQFQLPSGAYFYQYADPSENLFSTVQAIPAISGVALPVVPSESATPVALQVQLAA